MEHSTGIVTVAPTDIIFAHLPFLEEEVTPTQGWESLIMAFEGEGEGAGFEHVENSEEGTITMRAQISNRFDGSVLTIVFDKNGRMIKMINPGEVEITWKYDSSGRVKEYISKDFSMRRKHMSREDSDDRDDGGLEAL